MRIFSLLFVVILTLYASPEAAKELGYHSDYNKALRIAKQENKPLMLVVVTSYCPWCRKFERKTLASKTVAPVIKSTYIPVIVDRNNDAESFPKQYQTPRIPTVFFIDPNDEKEYWESIGYLNRKVFSEALNDADALFKKRQK
jgi:thioredoxin-related protein